MSSTPKDGTRNRSGRPWLTDLLARPGLLAFLILLLLSGCDPVPYDFGADPIDTGSEPPNGLLCEDVEPSMTECESTDTDHDGCTGEAVSFTKTLGETLGCTPEGLSLGVVSITPDGTDGMRDLLAWTSSPEVPSPPFDMASSLALFEDACGENSFGNEKQCDYRPWLFKSDLPSVEMFLHVQSASSRGVVVGYQMMPEGGWRPSPPGPEEALSCQVVQGGYVGDELLFPNPLDGNPVQIDFADAAPPRLSLPWICGEAGAGHRQLVLLMRNPYYHDVHVTEMELLNGSSLEEWVPFKHALFRCTSSNEVEPEQAEVSMGCDDKGASGPRTVDTVFQVWDGTSETQYLLVLQVPPYVSSDATLILHTD